MDIRVGIIGCGSITKFRHAPEYLANPFVKDITFYDRNPERSRKLAEMFNGHTAESVDALLADESIHAISDCTSNESHHIFSTKALLQGKHVLCEKPISLTVENAALILEAHKKSGKKLMIGHNQRFTKAHQKAREIIQSNRLGDVLTFKTTFGHGGPESWGTNKTNATWFFKKDRSGLGVAADLGIHKVDLIQFILDDVIEEVCGFQGALDKVDEKGKPIEVCDNIVASLKTKKGRLGNASFSWTYYGQEDNSTIIYCEQGILKIYHNANYQLEVIHHNGEVEKHQLEEIQTNDAQTNTGVINAFIDAIRFDKTPLVTGEDGISALKVVLAMIEAAEKGRTIRIE